MALADGFFNAADFAGDACTEYCSIGDSDHDSEVSWDFEEFRIVADDVSSSTSFDSDIREFPHRPDEPHQGFSQQVARCFSWLIKSPQSIGVVQFLCIVLALAYKRQWHGRCSRMDLKA